MADAPTLKRIALGGKSRERRAINQEYQMELVVQSEKEIADRLVKLERTQLAAAAANLRAMGEIALRQDQQTEILGSIASDFGNLLVEAERINTNLEWLENTVKEGFEEVNTTLKSGFEVVQAGLVAVVAAIFENQRVLTTISDTLSHRYDTEAKELLAEGKRWLKEGSRSDELKASDAFEARKALDYWETALKRFNDVVANKVGEQNYAAWFNIGWLRWKLKAEQFAEGSVEQAQALRDAEEAFYKAQLFSAPSRDLLHTKSLRHMAEMQYLQKRYDDAWQTSQRALSVRREYETLYNAARYASKTSQRPELASLLEECIALRPITIQIMFSEEDFLE